jgi:predicted O-methyltransferase YrrM
MNSERWRYTTAYLREVFGREDEHLRGLIADARARGLPDIAVTPEVGRLLSILVKSTGAQLALEVGTLGGYSATWIARGLRSGGRLITIERDASYAEFAEERLARLGLPVRIEVRRGVALDILGMLATELGGQSVDFAFIDAEKTEYPDYFRLIRPLLKPGALFVADNVLGTSSWWIDDESHPARQAVDRLNRIAAGDPDLEAAAVPLREGLLIARVRSEVL